MQTKPRSYMYKRSVGRYYELCIPPVPPIPLCPFAATDSALTVRLNVSQVD